jgi:uncharacterized phiE125 gp8 family phage protein
MAAILIEAPASEPISLAEAKNYLRVEHNADDTLIASQISAARIHVESRTRRALLTQTWRIVLDRWPQSGVVVSPLSPLREVVAARVRDESVRRKHSIPIFSLPGSGRLSLRDQARACRATR